MSLDSICHRLFRGVLGLVRASRQLPQPVRQPQCGLGDGWRGGAGVAVSVLKPAVHHSAGAAVRHALAAAGAARLGAEHPC